MPNPPRSKAPAASPAEAPESPITYTPSGTDSKYRAKRFASMKAAAAPHGVQVHSLGDGRFLVCRWGLVRELGSLDEAADFLRQMGVAT